ncbi:hypothetical protein Arub01_52740 [Actinomadura rubrobrunea]|uniref:Asp23/Gls24 family envelope stress response protein n=1 Tax=Actinomadura rubrobrunea TaxID=115335 RepID=A0A9W6Q1H1_9ACTN|nr:Asp23/Gls24 family envelope stress response protein [Actinomadura rubrobrunea]GLW67031.1 hypothetical protein Arub01_52740 [Actinomadura rubrobrunea]
MTDLDKGRPGDGGDAPHPEVRSAPFFPGPGGLTGGDPSTAGVPLGSPPPMPAAPGLPPLPAAPAVPPPAGPPVQERAPADASAGEDAPSSGTAVRGRVTIEDEVVEKIAMLAALEVGGVAGLAGGPDPGGGSGTPGVRVHLRDDAVTLDLAIAVEYGSVIMDVAEAVQANAARVVGLMLGRRVLAVNVSVEDVRGPE